MSQSSRDGTEEWSREATLPPSERHRILASERRRLLLDVLDDRPTPVDLEELAVLVARREDGLEGAAPDDVGRISITLHHHHLPTLDDAGVVEYEPASNQVESYRGLVR